LGQGKRTEGIEMKYKLAFRKKSNMVGVKNPVIVLEVDGIIRREELMELMKKNGYELVWCQEKIHCDKCDGKGHLWRDVNL
jgi:hypothetical protein